MRYIFDGKSFDFKKVTNSVLQPLLHVSAVLFTSLALSVMAYAFISLFYDTPSEKRIKASTERLRMTYDSLMVQEQQLEDALTGLQQKDAKIYEQVFNSAAPNEDPVGKLDYLFGSDTIPDTKLISYTRAKASELFDRAETVEKLLVRSLYIATSPGFCAPPMTLPVRNLSYPQIGAGEGIRTNPFFKTRMRHSGQDFIVPQGEPVYAPADGVVTAAEKKSKGPGKYVVIRHRGGYTTWYAHLSEIGVREGQKVRRGDRIGSAGMTGNAVAPHLHYEIMKDTVYLNPINYIFASIIPEEYANMLFMSANTQQSMD